MGGELRGGRGGEGGLVGVWEKVSLITTSQLCWDVVKNDMIS
jgi:hypothetical protein